MAKKLDGIIVQIGADLTPMSKALEGVNKTINSTTSELKEVEKLLKFNPNNTELLAQKQSLLNDKVAETTDKLNALKQAEKEVQQMYDDELIGKKQYDEFRRELIKTESQLRAAEKAVKEFNPNLEALGNKFESVGKSMESAGKAILPFSAATAALGAVSIKAASDWESAFAGVRKTVDATEEQFAELSKGIREMSKEMPQSAVEIAAVAEAAGQLGIKTENILEFTKTMVMLGDATNLSSEEAASSFAKFANIVGMSQDNFDRLGSSIVALGNNLATTEKDISEMSLRLAGAGKQIGLTESEILAFAGALSSVGIEAEAGGSAFSKVMIEMQLAVETNSEKLSQFADVAGMSSHQFSEAFRKDAAGAIMSFIKGLGDAEKRGQSTIKVLDDMGVSETRLRDALLRASSASEVFSNAIDISSKAWEENSALSEEARQRYETFEAQMAMLKNTLTDLGRSFGEVMLPAVQGVVNVLKNLFDWMSKLDPISKGIIIVIGSIVAVAGPLLITIGKMAQGIGALIKLWPILTDAKLISAIATKAMTVATTAYNIVAAIATTVTTALSAAIAFLTSPIGLVIIAVGLLVAAFVLLWKNSEEFRNFFIEMWENIKETTGKVVDWIVEKFNDLVQWFKDLGPNMLEAGKELFTNLWDGIKSIWTNIQTWVSDKVSWLVDKVTFWDNGSKKIDGSHAGGLPYVPRDGYIAKLHQGERVLTESENARYNDTKGNVTNKKEQIINVDKMYVMDKGDEADTLAQLEFMTAI